MRIVSQQNLDIYKSIYEATGWEDENSDYYINFRGYSGIYDSVVANWMERGDKFPLYNFDFLLSKLERFNFYIERVHPIDGSDPYWASHVRGTTLSSTGETPLEVLDKVIKGLKALGIKV